MTRELFFTMGNRFKWAVVGMEIYTRRAKNSQAFCVYCFQCCVILLLLGKKGM